MKKTRSGYAEHRHLTPIVTKLLLRRHNTCGQSVALGILPQPVAIRILKSKLDGFLVIARNVFGGEDRTGV
jgi:hypothetical protein